MWGCCRLKGQRARQREAGAPLPGDTHRRSALASGCRVRFTFDSEGTVGGKNVPPLRRPYLVSISPLSPEWSEPAASIEFLGTCLTVGFVNAGAVVSVRGE